MMLINVLLFVALASSTLMLMTSGEDAAIRAATRAHDAERADAIARGGELSAIAALRRDMLVSPASDSAAEPWHAVAQREVPIAGGTFTLDIADATSRFNVNRLREEGGADPLLQRIAAAAGVPAAAITEAAALVRSYGPLTDLPPLALPSLDPASAARAAPLLTALPVATDINVNAASEAMLAALLDDPALARLLVQRRTQRGSLSPDDLTALGAVLPPGIGFSSNLFWVRTRVTVGETSRTLTSLVMRRRDALGQPVVTAIARWQGPDSPYARLADPIPDPAR